FGALEVKPPRDHCVDRGAAGRGPTQSSQRGSNKHLPWLLREDPRQHAETARYATDPRDVRKPEAAVDLGQIGDDDRTYQEVRSDCGGDEGDRPAPRDVEYRQEHGRTIKARAGPKDRDEKSRPNNFPAKE